MNTDGKEESSSWIIYYMSYKWGQVSGESRFLSTISESRLGRLNRLSSWSLSQIRLHELFKTTSLGGKREVMSSFPRNLLSPCLHPNFFFILSFYKGFKGLWKHIRIVSQSFSFMDQPTLLPSSKRWLNQHQKKQTPRRHR